jgi:uncharacterized phage protein gp47/JayE
MAYENLTYEVILNRMINRVPEKYPNLDTREGSIIFNALASAAVELAIAYIEVDNVLRESFVKTASREYLLQACEQMGINTEMFSASAGVHRGEFNVEVPIGSRWNCDLYNYVVTEYVGVEENAYVYMLKCETPGTSPNNITGDLTAISDIPDGLSNATLTDCLIEGENETSDEDIRAYYTEYVNSTVDDGNVKQYERWCNEYDGIGRSKIFPLWNGNNTVKVSILSSSNQVASQELIDEFQEYLDPGTTGMGNGVAPIGSFVTVTTATERPITVDATVKFKSGYSDTGVIDEALSKYFAEIAYDKTLVSYLSIGATILNIEGVESVSNLKVNNGTADVTLGNEEIPVLSTTNWVVS